MRSIAVRFPPGDSTEAIYSPHARTADRLLGVSQIRLCWYALQTGDFHVSRANLQREFGIAARFRRKPPKVVERCGDNEFPCFGGSRRLADLGINVEQLIG